MMVPHIQPPILNKIKEHSSKFIDIEKIILFGSRSRGDHDERSDIDIAVQAPNLSQYDWLNFSLVIREEMNTLLLFDVVWLEQASEELRAKIRKEGVIIYESRNDKSKLG
ncbi:nucleotidyltransferase domain-containing protein [Terrihalobacillus insolitus]|uniref:nucleotidyltransferase domain-containing protein n=1 Tax=Terrihalobacillus insolitus TaxID=2950438 RepID=UPI00234268B1|nr:nucleotidyltransferase domain-containing protein [Terrihalobacillus insolitus]MDC3415209.1 nucleotidyltransferase domain-containing protein [Terrihalobacillus insolitus]